MSPILFRENIAEIRENLDKYDYPEKEVIANLLDYIDRLHKKIDQSNTSTSTLWYCCEKCKEVASYFVLPDGTTTLPRGEYLAHAVRNDYVTTGFNSKEKAQQYLDSRLKELESGESDNE